MSIIKNIFNTSLNNQLNKQVLKLAERINRIELCVKSGKTNTYNFRYDFDKELWTPKLKDLVLNYKNNKNNTELDLIYRSRYSKNLYNVTNGYIKIFSSNIQSIVMSDFIMFNKNYNIDFLAVDRLLPYCKIKVINSNKYILDGWVYETLGMFYVGSTQPNKNNGITNKIISKPNMDLVKTESEKRLAVRALIQIMNEIPEEEINLNNYYTISEWYNYYDAEITTYETNMSYIKPIPEDETLVDSLDVNINKLLTEKEILNILYSHFF